MREKNMTVSKAGSKRIRVGVQPAWAKTASQLVASTIEVMPVVRV